jgi:Tol biopolymer transport system component
VRYDRKSGQLLPFLSGISAEYIAFSKDGQWVAYVTYPEGVLWRSKVDGSERQRLSDPPSPILLPRWSPDGKRIVFFRRSPEGKSQINSEEVYKAYAVSRDGGVPELLIPDYPGPQTDPNWSPDGSKIIFEGAGIHVLDLTTHQVSDLPESQNYYSPRWSPDGRYVAVLPYTKFSGIVLFDFETRKWTELLRCLSPS